MNRLVIAIILGALAIGICVTGSVVINNNIDEISALIEKAIDSVNEDDMESAEKYVKEASDKLIKAEGTLEFFSGHDIIHTIQESMERMQTLVKYDEKSWFILESREALLNLNHIAYAESFSIKNIL